MSETSSGKSGSAAAAESLDDPYGMGAIEKVYNKSLDEIEAEWQKWWSKNRHRLCFDPEQQIYRVKNEVER